MIAMMMPLHDQFALAEQLLQSGQYEQARQLLKKLHKAHPKSPEILLQLGLAERFLKHWPEAISAMQKAAALAPGELLYLEHWCNVLMFSNEGRNILQTVDKYVHILRANPAHTAVAANLMVVALRNDKPQTVIDAIAPLLAQDTLPQSVRLHYASSCALAAYLLNDTVASARFVEMALAARMGAFDDAGKPLQGDVYFMLIYTEFLRDLLAFRAAHAARYTLPESVPDFHVIGESHSLTPAYMGIEYAGHSYRAVPHLIMGAKAYFFALVPDNSWKYALQEIIRAIPKDAPLLVNFGEIDCRPTEGLMAQYRQEPAYDLEQAVEQLGVAYVRFVKIAQLKRRAPTIIAGVPAPRRGSMDDLQPGEGALFTGMIRSFNRVLGREAVNQQLGFLDLYAVTCGEDGWAIEGVHIDHVHLTPSVVAQAMARPVETRCPE